MSSAASSQRFHVWIQRQNQPEGAFSIKFEAEEGKGILRVARPGVLIDPPARQVGFEGRLTGAQLRASRFLHVWDGGRGRQGHSLTRLDEAALDRIPLAEWIELVHSEDGALRYLFLPDIAPDFEEVDDEPTSPRRMLANLREDLSALTLEDAIEAGSATDEVPLDALPDLEEHSGVAISSITGGRARARARDFAPSPAVPMPMPITEKVQRPAKDPKAGGEAASAPVAARQPSVAESASARPTPDGERFSPLVRHLRRQVARQDARILELEAQLGLRRGDARE